MDMWRDMFSIIGIVYTLIIVFVLITITLGYINDYIIGVKHRYQRKHRFDKPPTAKCYCIDCENYSSWEDDDHICFAHNGWHVADNWFCWSATPKK